MRTSSFLYFLFAPTCLKVLLLFTCSVSALSLASAPPEASVVDLAKLSLEELLNYEVTAATKTETRLTDTPGSVSVITYGQIRSSGATTIPELLRRIPGMNVRWNPMVQTIQARGFGSNPFTSSVLLLIDGIPYNSWNKGGFPQHPGADFFNLENVKHIEIIRGAGSALYGENALNGVINIVTLSGYEYRQTRVSVTGGNANNASTSISHGSKLGEDGAIFVSARADKSRLPTEFWEENDADNQGQDLFVKAQYKNAQLSYYRRQDKFDGYRDNVIPPNFDFTSIDEIKQAVNITAAKITHTSADKRWDMQFNLSYADRKGTACGGCHAASESARFNDEIDHGSQLFGNGQLNYNGIDGHEIMFGSELRRLTAADAFEPELGPAITERQTSYRKQAYFVQDRFSIADNIELYMGLRYDGKTNPDLFGDQMFPRLAVVAKASDDVTLRAGWSQAARYPTFTELYQNTRFIRAENDVGFALVDARFKPNPFLQPETVDSFEAGIEYHLNAHYSVKLDVYHNTHTDPIVLVYEPSLIGFENHGNQAVVRGSELEILFHPSREFSSYLNWSYQNNHQSGANLDSTGMPIEFTYAPRNKINGGATFNVSESLATSIEFSWRSSSRAPQFWNDIVYRDGTNHPLDSYALVNAKLSYRLPFTIKQSSEPLKLSLTLKNLTDERPIETLTGVSGELRGRSVFLQLDYEWTN